MGKKSFAVIGLGQFGQAIVQELVDIGADVIAIDNDQELVKKVANILPTCFVADSTNELALKELGIPDVDSAIVAFGGNKEASVITTVLLKELGVKHIIVRVEDDTFATIMKKLGATEIITPQKAAGRALANRLGNEDFLDYYKLDDKYSVVSIVVNPSFIPITLKEMNPKKVYGVNLVLIKRNNHSFVPDGDDSILPEDTVYVSGTTKEINSFREAINGNKKRK